MAWYAELKRRKWYCIVGIDMIKEYKKARYEAWYASLSDEQKDRLEEHRRRESEKADREAKDAVARLILMTGMMCDLALRTSSRRHDKYHGVYDEYGFPRDF